MSAKKLNKHYASAPNGETSITIGFRLSPDAQNLLLARAEALEVSHHALARDYVESILAEPAERAALHSAMTQLRQEFIELRENVGGLVNELRTLNGAIVGDTRELATTTREHVQQLYLQIRELRSDVTLVAETLLVSAGKVSEESAQEWIKANFAEK
jgi:hypothetical protein